MFITGAFIQSLLFPKRIAAVIALSCGMFSLFLLILSSNINARLNSLGQYYPVFTFSAIAIVTCLSVSLHCIDACCDCLLQERKAQAQITRKITSVVGSCISVALLLLPADFFLVPVLAFACCTIFLGVAVSLCWWFLRENAEATFREMKKKSNASFLTCSHIAVVVFAAVIGDSADQILDAITNIQIDALVSGGKVKYVDVIIIQSVRLILAHRAAVAKEVVSILASSSSACLYLRYNVFGSASSFHRSSLKICLIWCALQLFRYFVHYTSLLNFFSENIGVLLVTSITLSEKVVGSVFGSSRAQVEADWLVAVSVRSVLGQSISMLISPAFWMSTSELLNSLVGNLIKLSLDMANISNNYIYIVVALLFFLCCTIWLQAFMIRGILSKKLD